MDIYNAFLQGDFDDDIYLQIPQGFNNQGEKQSVCRLVKSLYGLKQAPRQWNAQLAKALLGYTFQQSQFDHSLFFKKTSEGTTIVLVNVDDILITCDNLNLIQNTKASFQKALKMKDLGELKYFLGIEFARTKQGILMHQRKYALELISETGLGAAKPAITTLDYNVKLTTKEYNDSTKTTKSEVNTEDKELEDHTPYQRLIGK